MATVKFLIKGKSNPVNIYVRLRDGKNIDLTLSTSKTINPNFWGVKGIKQKADFLDKVNLENDLRGLEELILNKRNESVTKKKAINKDWLTNVINDWKGLNIGEDSDLLIDRIKSYKKWLPDSIRNNKKGVSDGTIRNYNTTIARLVKFEEYKGAEFSLVDIDLTFYDNYKSFAQSNLGLSLNSIGKDVKNIKAVCRYSKDRGFKVNEQVFSSNFKAPSEKTLFTTLTVNELTQIKNKDFEGKSYLENARDWLIVGCWTGCRVGDLMNLTNDNILTHKSGNRIIQYTQSKTGTQVKVPIHEDVLVIIDRLNGFPRPISAVKFNDYIKTVCKLVGLTYKVKGTKQNKDTHLKETGTFEKWELIRSHTCRRSFATNHYDKMSNKQIMYVTGHATEKMLIRYVGETESDHVEDFIDLWSNERSQENEKVKSIINY
ncbi:tyrosine-type recombinase/integrase [Putridiphycobacter roseus]|nr:phage integrase SAM-like domain-containing protein [Putridiphycobacter roseus]